MNIDIGIIGLPQSGKTTLFNALTGCDTDSTQRNREGAEAQMGIARVPDPRLNGLAEILHPHKIVPVEVRYTDIGASVKGMTHDGGIGGQFLNQLGTVDELICVVRAFIDDCIPHPKGSLDVARDIVTLNLETAFSDLSIIERRLEKVDVSMKGARGPELQEMQREQETLLKFRTQLEKEVPVRALTPSPAESRMIANYQLLTAKPQLIVINIGEEQIPQAASLEEEFSARYSGAGCRLVAICAKLEMELARLEESAACEFRTDFGLEISGPEKAVKFSYELLGLITFFTIASDEVKAWSIPAGTTAVRAAGKIHSDMERGFIRAEVIGYDNLVRCGCIAEARKQGLLRLEGKDYVVRDGDVITFLFNV